MTVSAAKRLTFPFYDITVVVAVVAVVVAVVVVVGKAFMTGMVLLLLKGNYQLCLPKNIAQSYYPFIHPKSFLCDSPSKLTTTTSTSEITTTTTTTTTVCQGMLSL